MTESASPPPTEETGAANSPWNSPWDWGASLDALRQAMHTQGVSLASTVVLVPFAQAMAEAKREWLRRWPDGLMPRFTTTHEWAQDCGALPLDPQDVSLDVARDQAVALTLLESLRLSSADAQWSDYLASQIVQAAHSLVPVAMAQAPEARAEWAQAMQEATPLDGASVARLEGLVQHLALLWVGQSGFATDVLWTTQRVHQTPGLAVVSGWGTDALAQALLARWEQDGGCGLRLPTPGLLQPTAARTVQWRQCTDVQDEAMETAACVLRRLQQGCSRVALVAMDRAVMRRVLALLDQRGVAVRDETGWRLSTSRQAAAVTAVLEAALPQADVQTWVEGLLHLPVCPAVDVHAWARHWERQGHWLPRWSDEAPEWLNLTAQVLGSLQTSRPWLQWAVDVPAALERLGLLASLSQDPAGLRVLQVLGWEHEITTPSPQRWQRMSLSAYLAWVRQALEGAPFKPQPTSDAPVVVVPLAQVLVRAFDAVVISGCDANSMPAAVTPPGPWTQAQRESLGLPDRASLTHSFAQAWWAALAMAPVDVLWRSQQGQESVSASHWVLRAQLQAGQVPMAPPPASDIQALAPTVPLRPQPALPPALMALLPETVSATRYQRLRACPYRFFALDVLSLGEASSIEELATRRDLGNWLHTVLQRFHQHEPDAVQDDTPAAVRRLDYWADVVREEQGWSEVAFLPFMASWALLRDGYLVWLTAHRASGARPRFLEQSCVLDLGGGLKLQGQLDRVDWQPARGDQAGAVWVLDYKTERPTKAKERVKTGVEDTQLGFYVALTQARLASATREADVWHAGYLCVGDGNREVGKPGTEWVPQEHAQAVAQAVVQGVQTDWAALSAGATMQALGESPTCDFCQARGLCRRDTWGALHG